MVLGRLAAKIDIQWDAKGAYEKDKDGNLKYTNVKVSQFTYHGEPEGTTISGSGKEDSSLPFTIKMYLP